MPQVLELANIPITHLLGLEAISEPDQNREIFQFVGLLVVFFYGLSRVANTYMVIIKQDGKWWIGWIEEVPGVNCQDKSRERLIESLKVTLKEALEFNRQEAILKAAPGYTEEPVII